jgi:hypothetical protein
MSTNLLLGTTHSSGSSAKYRTFTGDEDHRITLEAAARLTLMHRKTTDKNSIKGGYFGRDAIEAILQQRLAIGIRIYFAQRLDGQPTFVLAGTKENRDDIFQGVLSEDAWLCPPWCSPANELNCGITNSVTPLPTADMFTGHENHFVTLAEASRLTRAYRERAGENAPKGGYFSRRIFGLILDQQDCVGIRIYFGRTSEGKQTLILVGVDKSGSDLTAGIIGEDAWLCPPWCGGFNPLNR